MKLRRSERMVVISNYLINHPYELTSLNTFAEKYESAKSSISEDIAIIKKAFEESSIGHIETITGASGGVVLLHRSLRQSLSKLHRPFVIRWPKVIVSCQAVISIHLTCCLHHIF